jgi:hypothetical protein
MFTGLGFGKGAAGGEIGPIENWVDFFRGYSESMYDLLAPGYGRYDQSSGLSVVGSDIGSDQLAEERRVEALHWGVVHFQKQGQVKMP